MVVVDVWPPAAPAAVVVVGRRRARACAFAFVAAGASLPLAANPTVRKACSDRSPSVDGRLDAPVSAASSAAARSTVSRGIRAEGSRSRNAISTA